MLDRRLAANAFLRPSANAFWKWSEDGQVLVWADGTTIAFRPEVEAVLRRLAPGGLPPFGAIAFLLGTCREGWREAAWRSFSVVAVHLGFREKLRDVVSVFSGISDLDPRYRTGIAAKAVLAEAVFDLCTDRADPDAALDVVDLLASGEADTGARITDLTQARIELLRDLRALRGGLEGLDEEALGLRLKTGLDDLPGAADTADEPDSDQVRRLIAELTRDDELCALARLSSDLMAAVHVPRPVSAREELPLGGVSDIANRGSLDRLLVSELAQDDLTLAVRVAMNEALYLRREAPPRNPRGTRAILLDAGIRTWGVPRVFAAAVGLAMAATADRRASVRAWRADDGGAVLPVDLASREGLVEHLADLQVAPHPGRSLAAFLAELADEPGPVDPIVVTSDEALADPELREAIDALDLAQPMLFATVNAAGEYRLQAVGRRGTRLISKAVLRLDDLLDPGAARKRAPLVEPSASSVLPPILSKEPLPLLLPYHSVVLDRAAWHERFGAVAITHDGRLLHWERRNQGARELSARVPPGRVHAITIDEAGIAWAAVGGHKGEPMRLLMGHLEHGRCEAVSLGVPPPTVAAFFHAGALFSVHRDRVEVFALPTGAAHGWIDLAEHRAFWTCGRFFQAPGSRWLAAEFDGMSGVLQPLPDSVRRLRARYVFDRVGLDGPWVVDREGTVTCTVSGQAINHRTGAERPWTEVVRVSSDGSRLALRRHDRGGRARSVVLDLRTGGERACWGDPGPALEPDLMRLVTPTFSVRSRVRAIGVHPAGDLALLTSKGQVLRLTEDERGWGWRIDPSGPLETWFGVGFGRSPRPAGTRFKLRVARWRDGSAAWLDSRGLLHLRSSDHTVPDVTLVLVDDFVAAWSSRGELCGPPAVCADATVCDPDAIMQHVKRFIRVLS